MKTVYLKLTIFIAIIAVITTSKLNAKTPESELYCSFPDAIAYDNVTADDANFRVTVIKNYDEINVKISLNVNEGLTGILRIFNASNQLISKFDIELKQSPDFYTINLNEYSSGTYTFELTTNVGVHITHPVF